MSGRTAALRAVGEDEQAPPKPKTVAEAARKGTQRELLVSMRDRIADAITKADCPPRELAALTKRLQDIVREIESIDARGDDDPARIRALQDALREIAPNHPLLGDAVSDAYDTSVI